MEFVVASRPWLRNLVTLWTTSMVAGLLWTFATRGLELFEPAAPLVVRVLFPVGTVWVLWSWVAYAARLHTVLRAREREVTVERRYPPLTRTYPWSDVREWRLTPGRGRGTATLRLTLADGERVTLYPAAFENADRLQRQLETILPGDGDGRRRRVGRRTV